MSLDQVLTRLLAPTGKWQMARGQRYRTNRLAGGLGLRYTPARSDLDSNTLSLSRTVIPPSETEVQTVIDSLRRILKRPDLTVAITESGPTIRRLNWRSTPKKEG